MNLRITILLLLLTGCRWPGVDTQSTMPQKSVMDVMPMDNQDTNETFLVSFWATAQDQFQSSIPSNVFSTNYDGFSNYQIVWSESQPGLTFTVFEADQWGTNAFQTGTNMTFNWPPPPPSNVCVTVTMVGTGDVYQADSLQSPWVRTMTNATGLVFVRTNPASQAQYWRGPGMQINARWFN